MSVLLIAEHNNKELKPFTLNAITAASQIDQDLHVLVIGHDADHAAKAASSVPVVKKVMQIDNSIYELSNTEIFIKSKYYLFTILLSSLSFKFFENTLNKLLRNRFIKKV